MNIPVSSFNWFAKITGWPVQAVAFRTSVAYEDRSVQCRKVRGPAIIISNHTSVYDYAVWLFVFYSRTLRVPMAEILFEKQPLGIFLSMMGGIRIDRNSHSLSGLEKCSRILKKGGTFMICNESDGTDAAGIKYEKIIEGMKSHTVETIGKALTKAGFSEVRAAHHLTRPWITVIAKK